MNPPDNPAGEYVPVPVPTPDQLAAGIADIGRLPDVVRSLVAGWESDRLDTKYRNWTVRQIVHHLADSHANAIIRFKLALTEDTPTIKPYDPGPWVAQPDATDLPADVSADIDAALDPTGAQLVEVAVVRRPPDVGALGSELNQKQAEQIEEDPAELQALGEVLGAQFAKGSGKLLNDGPAFEVGFGNPAEAWGVLVLMRDCPLVSLRWRNP